MEQEGTVLKKLIFAVIVTLAFSGLAWGGDINTIVDSHREAQIQDTVELVKIPSYGGALGTNNPSLGVLNSMTYMMSLADRMGFTTHTQEQSFWTGSQAGAAYGYVEYGPADAPHMIMSLAHLDTVPDGDPSLWPAGAGPHDGIILPSWQGEQTPYLVGRGAFDDKGPAMASLYALYAIKESGVPLTHRIRLWFGTNEEGGGTIADRNPYANNGHELPLWGFSPDSGTFRPAFIEKTSTNISSSNTITPDTDAVKLAFLKNDGNPSNQVSYGCDAVLVGPSADLTNIKDAMEGAIPGEWTTDVYPITFTLVETTPPDDDAHSTLTIHVSGQAAHSGEAYLGKGANQRMYYLLSRSGAATTSWQELFAKATSVFPPDEDIDNMGSALGVREGDRESQERYGDFVTVNQGIVNSRRGNSTIQTPPAPDTDFSTYEFPTAIQFQANVRFPSSNADALTGTEHKDTREIQQAANVALEAAGMGPTTVSANDSFPYTIPLDSEIMLTLQKAYEDITGIPVEPLILMGGTYATSWRNTVLNQETGERFTDRMIAWGIDGGIGMHNTPELMSVEKLIEGAKILAKAMIGLATVDGHTALISQPTEKTALTEILGSSYSLLDPADLPNKEIDGNFRSRVENIEVPVSEAPETAEFTFIAPAAAVDVDVEDLPSTPMATLGSNNPALKLQYRTVLNQSTLNAYGSSLEENLTIFVKLDSGEVLTLVGPGPDAWVSFSEAVEKGIAQLAVTEESGTVVTLNYILADSEEIDEPELRENMLVISDGTIDAHLRAQFWIGVPYTEPADDDETSPAVPTVPTVDVPNAAGIISVTVEGTTVTITYSDGTETVYDTDEANVHISFPSEDTFALTETRGNALTFTAAAGEIIPADTALVFTATEVGTPAAFSPLSVRAARTYTLTGSVRVLSEKSVIDLNVETLPPGVYDITYECEAKTGLLFSGVLAKNYIRSADATTPILRLGADKTSDGRGIQVFATLSVGSEKPTGISVTFTLLNSSGTEVATPVTKTTTNGEVAAFVLAENLAAGEYRVSASATGYPTETSGTITITAPDGSGSSDGSSGGCTAVSTGLALVVCIPLFFRKRK
jgi:succinyl-diaminopimelate desuccinylase